MSNAHESEQSSNKAIPETLTQDDKELTVSQGTSCELMI